jgi:uncharacterized membrane protein
MRAKCFFGVLGCVLLLGAAAARADVAPVPPGAPPPMIGPVGPMAGPIGPIGMPGRDFIGEQLFPPDLVLANAQAIGLSDTQKQSIQSAVLDAEQQFTKLQWRIQDEMQALARLLKPTKVDSSAVMARLGRELDLEREMKRTQLGLMIRVKNLLSADQQAKLRQLRPNVRFIQEERVIPGGPQ